MKQIHSDRDMKNYGSPRMQQELVARGHEVSENTVAKLMRDHGLRAASSRKFRVTTDSHHSLPVSDNVLNREFEQESADRVWLADKQPRPPTGQGGERPRAVGGTGDAGGLVVSGLRAGCLLAKDRRLVDE